MSGLNPLIGPNLDEFGMRFFPMNDAYDMELRIILKECIKEQDAKKELDEKNAMGVNNSMNVQAAQTVQMAKISSTKKPVNGAASLQSDTQIAIQSTKNPIASSKFQEGIYVCISGPNYESKAEARFLRLIGADAVGMSTVHEVLAAKHCGMLVAGLALISNKVSFG
jgi:purine nucleoside phosphorylase